MTNDKAAIKFLVQDLDLYYGKFQALKKINLDIKEKEITALIGPSGCGKSTFLKTLNRMNDLEEGVRIEGSIALDGKDIFEEIDPISLRHRVGMVFQQPNPFPKSIYDNVAYGPRIHGVTKKSELDEIVERSLRQAAIWDELKDRLNKSALDPISTMKIEDLALELKKDYTIVIVTHNMQQAARISDKTAFFLLGELIEFNETKQLFANPSNPKTEEYITGRFG